MSSRLHVVLAAGLQHRAATKNAGGVEDVGVDYEDYGKVISWADGTGKDAMNGFKWEDGAAFYLLKAMVKRCSELYSADGEERVSAAIVHYMDMNDILTFYKTEKTDPKDPVAVRVRQALQAHREWQSQADEANVYLMRAERQRMHDQEQVNCAVTGGGKCNFEMGTSNEQVRINAGGPSYDDLYPPKTIDYYKSVVKLAEPKDFPKSLWPN